MVFISILICVAQVPFNATSSLARVGGSSQSVTLRQQQQQQQQGYKAAKCVC
jgi:hypothetical protein